MKKNLLSFAYTISIILIGTLLNSILYYFDITSDKINTILLYLIGIIAIFVGAIKSSKENNQKGIITGLIYFCIWFFIMILTSLIFFKINFHFKDFIYYLILLIFSLLGGIIGKNMQDKTDDI